MAYCSPDFHHDDFNENDFQTQGGVALWFRDYIFSLLPRYFKENDTYKDVNDKGLLERYLSVFGDEIDEDIIPWISCYLSNLDASVCDSKFIDHISDSVGNPPDIFQDDEVYRNLLQYVASIYKIKGTVKAYKLFFAILGYDVEIDELPHEDDDMYYDSGGEYDTGEERHHYDRNACLICYYYNISIRPLDTSKQLVISTDILNKLREAIYFNEPINCRLGTFTSTLEIQNTITVTSGTSIDEIKASVDTIKARGGFGTFDGTITEKIYRPEDNSITFSTLYEEGDFNGEIKSLELRHTGGYIMAYKAGLSVVKDSQSRVKINWKITVTYN